MLVEPPNNASSTSTGDLTEAPEDIPGTGDKNLHPVLDSSVETASDSPAAGLAPAVSESVESNRNLAEISTPATPAPEADSIASSDPNGGTLPLELLREHWFGRLDPPPSDQIAAEQNALDAGHSLGKSVDPVSRGRMLQSIREFVSKGFLDGPRYRDEANSAMLRTRKIVSSDPRLDFAEGLVALHHNDFEAALACFQKGSDGGLIASAFAWLVVQREPGVINWEHSLKGLRRMVMLLAKAEGELPADTLGHFAGLTAGHREALQACGGDGVPREDLAGIDRLVDSRWPAELIAAWHRGREDMQARRDRLVEIRERNPVDLAAVVQAHLAELEGRLSPPADLASNSAAQPSKGAILAEDKQLGSSIHRDQGRARALAQQGASLRRQFNELSIPRKTARRQIGTRRVREQVQRGTGKNARSDYEWVEEPIYEFYEPDRVRNDRLTLRTQVEQQFTTVETEYTALRERLQTEIDERKQRRAAARQEVRELQQREDREEDLEELFEWMTANAPTAGNIDRWLHDPTYWTPLDPERWKSRLMSVLK